MGTLTSCSFSTATFRFRSRPVGNDFRQRIHLFNITSKNLCFLCSKKQVSSGSFGRFRCFSTNGNGDKNEGEESSLVKDSNSKTATMPEEGEEELDSDKDPPAPVSSRVHFIIIIIIYVFFSFGWKLLELDLWMNACIWIKLCLVNLKISCRASLVLHYWIWGIRLGWFDVPLYHGSPLTLNP